MQNRRAVIAALVVLAALIAPIVLRMRTGPSAPGRSTAIRELQERPARIISMAPSITEVLFAVGAGDQVAGVTRYCDYPPEAATRPQVGGYLDPSYEAILSLQPDLVVILSEQETSSGKMFRELNLSVLVVEHRDISGILESVTTIGRAAGREQQAAGLLENLQARMDTIRGRVENRGRPKVLVVLGRNLSAGDLSNTYIAGSDGFYNDLVELAGGSNSYRGRTIAFPAVSAEGLHLLAPEVIIEVIPNLGRTGIDSERFEQAWSELPGLLAADEGNVHVFVTGYAVRPGPRFILLAEDMARAIHPGADWPAGE
ncbi:MAG: ABC transporter substrate-binding protein [Candidatus Glassbacteria bacterium]|nr:ABC transporter substrate-binding protein [Candidatus Glassbacteria bacterium]